ncbi:MAG: DUF695 domain-containing protein [Flavobacteriales bacterium]|nr:DUF695 domain-containing protein [Flavobacteriales bacterium]MDG1780158.1 DUF695 domain-containing protein [Flavobacteriales bacterium]MDG2247053.1 DUF695 domain-containing protein [Flavobacteriales bacterium]
MIRTLVVVALTVLSSALFAQEQWEVYMAQEDSLLTSFSVNVAADEQDSLRTRSYLITASVAYDMHKGGFPSDEAAAMIETYELRLNDFLYRHPEAQIVGSTMGNGKRSSYLYTSDTLGVRNELEGIQSARFPAMKINATVERDQQWSLFWEYLFPNELELEYINNASVLDELIAEGDDLTQPREIYFWFYAGTEADSRALQTSLEEKGYETVSAMVLDGDLPFALVVSKVDYVFIMAISEQTLMLRNEAALFEAELDGWETSVMKN